jgi:hypothetical protein
MKNRILPWACTECLTELAYRHGLCLACLIEAAGQLAAETDPPWPRRSTSAFPGTRSKVAVLEARVAAGESLWHPADARMHDESVRPLALKEPRVQRPRPAPSVMGGARAVFALLEASRRPLSLDELWRQLQERQGRSIALDSVTTLVNLLVRARLLEQHPGHPPCYGRAAAVEAA